MILAELYLAQKDYIQAKQLYTEVVQYTGKPLKQAAYDRIYELRNDVNAK